MWKRLHESSPPPVTSPQRLVLIAAVSVLLGIVGGFVFRAVHHSEASATGILSPLPPPVRSGVAAPIVRAPSFPATPAASDAAAKNSTLSPLEDSGASGIFFLRSRDVWLANADGSDPRQITHSGRVEQFFWVAKTQTLVYDNSPASAKKDLLVETIEALNLATQKVEILHKATLGAKCEAELCPDFFFALDVSPDGKIIFGQDFLGDAAESKREGVPKEEKRVVYDPATHKYEASNELPASASMQFLPDGSVAGWAEDGNVYTHSFATKTRTQWTRYPSQSEEYKKNPGHIGEIPTALDFIGWSPDASRVFFSCGTKGPIRGVVNACETRLANPEVKKLSTDVTEINPSTATAMSPDRRFFVFRFAKPSPGEDRHGDGCRHPDPAQLHSSAEGFSVWQSAGLLPRGLQKFTLAYECRWLQPTTDS